MKGRGARIAILSGALLCSVLILVWRIEAYRSEASYPPAMHDARILLHEQPAPNTIHLEPFDEAKARHFCIEEARRYEDPADKPSAAQSLTEFCMQLQRKGYGDLQRRLSRIGGYSWAKILYESVLSSDRRYGYYHYYWVDFSMSMSEAIFQDLATEVSGGKITLSQVQGGLDREMRHLRDNPEKFSLFFHDLYYFTHHLHE